MIDKLDRKVLYELDNNARQPISRIAKKLGTSKQVIKYRINRLLKMGIIKSFYTVIDHSKLGHFSFRVYIKLRNISPEKQQEMIDYLKSQKDIWWFVTVDGDWDIDFVILVKDIFDYYPIWENFINRYRKFIHRSETVIYSHIQGFPKSYLIGQENESEGFLISSKREEIIIDELDLKILRLIVNDCRINLVKLAEATNTDVRTIKNRIKQLENKKIIVGYRIALDLSKLGYQYYKVLFYLNNIKNIDKMKTFALMHPNIVFINKTIGGADFELEFHVTNIEEFYKVLNEFKRLFHKDIDYWYYFRVMEEYKMIYYPV